MLRIALLVGAAAALAGCSVAVPLHMYNPPHNYQPAGATVTHPAVGQVHQVRAGEEMLRQSQQVTRETIYLPTELAVSNYQLAPGYYKKIGSDVQGDYFQVAGGPDTGHIRSLGGDTPLALFVHKDSGFLCVVDLTQQAYCSRPKAQVTFASADGYERRTRAEGIAASQSLLYAGRDGAKIAVTYVRTGDGAPTTARTEHSLSGSPVIEVRGARLEVLEATPTGIRYRVLQPFGTAP